MRQAVCLNDPAGAQEARFTKEGNDLTCVEDDTPNKRPASASVRYHLPSSDHVGTDPGNFGSSARYDWPEPNHPNSSPSSCAHTSSAFCSGLVGRVLALLAAACFGIHLGDHPLDISPVYLVYLVSPATEPAPMHSASPSKRIFCGSPSNVSVPGVVIENFP